jgi:antitoxin (DNA-binding transcriptional repressor) of toxin-antitoxin stability system
LSEYIRLAASGETVLVTDRDRVVAEMGPPRADRAIEVADAFLAEAVRKGWITPAVARTGQAPPSLPVASTAQILLELDADRGER